MIYVGLVFPMEGLVRDETCRSANNRLRSNPTDPDVHVTCGRGRILQNAPSFSSQSSLPFHLRAYGRERYRCGSPIALCAPV
jgi:hypothetical protein